MPTLYVLRHAKSSWDDPDLDDHERPLNARGRGDAPRVGDWLRQHWPPPAVVVCSSARRAVETLERLGDLGAPDARVEDGLYGATAAQLLARARAVEAGREPVLLIGHNPAVQGLVRALAGQGRRLDDVAGKLPTAALAVLTSGGDWADLEPGQATLAGYVTPRELV